MRTRNTTATLDLSAKSRAWIEDDWRKTTMTKNRHCVTTLDFLYVRVLVGSRVVLFSVGLSRRPVHGHWILGFYIRGAV